MNIIIVEKLTKMYRSDIIFLRFERGKNMAKKIDIDEIENLIVNCFDYMNTLKKEIRNLKADIKDKKSLLSEQEKYEKKFITYLISDNTGKGEYRNAQILPSEIKETIINNKNLSEMQKDELNKKYELALIHAKKLEDEYNYLFNTSSQREEKIKNYKKEINQLKKVLTKKEKEYNEGMSKVKKLDKKILAIKKLETDSDQKKLVIKPKNDKEQN